MGARRRVRLQKSPTGWTFLGATCWPEKVFLAAGFRFTRQKGCHRSYIKGGILRPVVIPTYDEVPVSIIRNNIKTVGLSRDEYLQLLERVR